MPTYQYRCTECGRELEVVQKFTDPALTECETCHGALRKVYKAVGVVFKGSGFYRTDSRKAETNGASSGTKSAEKSDKAEKTPRCIVGFGRGFGFGLQVRWLGHQEGQGGLRVVVHSRLTSPVACGQLRTPRFGSLGSRRDSSAHRSPSLS